MDLSALLISRGVQNPALPGVPDEDNGMPWIIGVLDEGKPDNEICRPIDMAEV
jgi:hypothetical protein